MPQQFLSHKHSPFSSTYLYYQVNGNNRTNSVLLMLEARLEFSCSVPKLICLKCKKKVMVADLILSLTAVQVARWLRLHSRALVWYPVSTYEMVCSHPIWPLAFLWGFAHARTTESPQTVPTKKIFDNLLCVVCNLLQNKWSSNFKI